MTDPLREHCEHSDQLLQGGFLQVYRDRVRMPGGESSTREYVVHPGAVMVVPLLGQAPDGTPLLVMERQYRYPVRQTIIEFPAGKLDPGEDPWVCAQRELREETGYVARQWARAGLLHPLVAYSTEFIEIWFARDLQAGERELDPGEYLEVFTARADELYQWCRDGQVTDGKTLIGALWLQNVLSGAWALDWREAGAAGSH